MMHALFMTLASPPAGPAAPPGGPANPPSMFSFFGLILAAVVFYIFLVMGNRKRTRQMDEMIRNIKKNDRVVTAGGIKGTVVSTKDNEVVVKVDESTNTKLTFMRTSIQRVLRDDE